MLQPMATTEQPPPAAVLAQHGLSVEQLYDERQAHWHSGILEAKSPDRGSLLGLHLQMAELERLLAGIEELP